MRVVRAFVPLTLALVAAFAAGTPAAAESPGFATPEDAVTEYLAGVAAADADRILATVAVDEVSTHFDFPASVDRLQAMLLSSSLAPSDYPLFVELDRARRTDLILSQVTNLAYGLLTGITDITAAIVPADRASAQTFVDQVDPSRLAGIRVVAIRPHKGASDTRTLATWAKSAAIYGADELTDRLVLITFDNELYGIGFELVRYGDSWKVLEQDSPLSGVNSIGTAEPMTANAYDDHTEGGN